MGPTNNDILLKTQLILMGIITIVPVILASTPQCIDNECGSELRIAMHTKFSLEMLPCIASAAIVIMLSTSN